MLAPPTCLSYVIQTAKIKDVLLKSHWIKLASVEFYVRILREFVLARFTLFVRTSENN